jgi:putative MATE family efflux protein
VKDLTSGSILRHLASLSAPIALSMLVQLAYQLVDLYFITRLGSAATAGVNAAGTTAIVFVALAQIVAISTTPLVAQAVGRRDREAANLALNQSLTLSFVLGSGATALAYSSIHLYLRSVTADPAAAAAGASFTLYLVPGLALLLPTTALGSALRGIGSVKPYVIVSILTVVANIVLAPILIAGWGTGVPLGAAGAGLATSVSILFGVIFFGWYFYRHEHYLAVQPNLLHPRPSYWRHMLAIGLPGTIEFLLIFASSAFVFYAIRDYGAAAQAGYGIAQRVLQVVLLPGMAIGFAAGPIAAQNVGASHTKRVKDTFYGASLLTTSVLSVTAILVYAEPRAFIALFDADPTAAAAAILFLELISWTFVPQGLIYVCTNLFQGLGNTVPPLISSTIRFFLFIIIVTIWRTQPGFKIEHVWYAWIAATVAQALISLWFLRVEFLRRLRSSTSAPPPSTGVRC